MSDDLKVDWGAAIHPGGMRPEGLVNDCMILWSNNGKPWKEVHVCNVRVWGDCDNDVSIRLPADHPYYRQAVEPPQPDMGNPITDDLATRMEALVWSIADSQILAHTGWGMDARAIVALLPERVDPDLVEARKIAKQFAPDSPKWSGILEGDHDDTPAVQHLLAAIRRGRALERDSREG